MVEPNLRHQIDCGCGCGKYGTPRPREWSDGLLHVRSCVCRFCKSSKHRGLARQRESKIARDIGGKRDSRSGALSGADITSVMIEVEETSNVAIVRGLRRWWDTKGVRDKRARLWSRKYTDAEPVFVASWDGKPRLAVMEYESFARLARAANQQGDPQ